MTNFIKKQHNCPVCDSGWIGDPIPYHQWDNHTQPYFYLKLIKIYDAEKINILEYCCRQIADKLVGNQQKLRLDEEMER